MQVIVWTKEDEVFEDTDPSDNSKHTFTTYFKDVVVVCEENNKTIVLNQADANNTDSNMTEVYDSSGNIEIMYLEFTDLNSKIISNVDAPPSIFEINKFKYTEADGWTIKPTDTPRERP